MPLRLEVAAKSDVGCLRANNEDNFGYDARYGIYAVCDGMGGAAAGEVASKLGIDSLLQYFRNGDGLEIEDGRPIPGLSARANRLGSAIRKANAAIRTAAAMDREHAGMGATMVAVLVEDDFFSIGNVGDSRIYFLHENKLEQLTTDHSLVMEQVRNGSMTLAQAKQSTISNIITRALGSEAEVQPDLDDLVAVKNDVLLLCSDGLTRHVSDESIREILVNSADIQQACTLLVEAARDGGGEDNITCMLLRFVEQSWYQKMKGKLGNGGSPEWQNSR